MTITATASFLMSSYFLPYTPETTSKPSPTSLSSASSLTSISSYSDASTSSTPHPRPSINFQTTHTRHDRPYHQMYPSAYNTSTGSIPTPGTPSSSSKLLLSLVHPHAPIASKTPPTLLRRPTMPRMTTSVTVPTQRQPLPHRPKSDSDIWLDQAEFSTPPTGSALGSAPPSPATTASVSEDGTSDGVGPYLSVRHLSASRAPARTYPQSFNRNSLHLDAAVAGLKGNRRPNYTRSGSSNGSSNSSSPSLKGR